MPSAADASAMMSALYVIFQSFKSLDYITYDFPIKINPYFFCFQNQINDTPYLHLLNSKVVFTGGSSQITGLADLSSKFLSKHTRLASPSRIEGLPDAACNVNFASVIGALLSMNEQPLIQNNFLNLNENLNSFQKFYKWMATNV